MCSKAFILRLTKKTKNKPKETKDAKEKRWFLIQPNPKSEVQISIENVISGPVEGAPFVAIQWPPFSSGLTAGLI